MRAAIATHCSIADCVSPVHGRGLCKAHYQRLLRHGSPHVSLRVCVSRGATLEERFWAKVEQGEGECWEWVGARTGHGYGNFWDTGRNVKAHRWAYERLVDDIPDGLDIDHLCRNRACVNPWHMEPVPRRVNSLRGQSPFILIHLRRKGATA